jgi:hypothetical protein
MIGVRRERLPAAKLRIAMPAGVHVPLAGLAERGCGLHAGAAWAFLGFSGSRPAFAAIHRRISGFWGPN